MAFSASAKTLSIVEVNALRFIKHSQLKNIEVWHRPPHVPFRGASGFAFSVFALNECEWKSFTSPLISVCFRIRPRGNCPNLFIGKKPPGKVHQIVSLNGSDSKRIEKKSMALLNKKKH